MKLSLSGVVAASLTVWLLLAHPVLANPPDNADERLAAAKQVMKDAGMANQVDRIVPLVFGNMKQILQKAHPKLKKELDAVFTALADEFSKRKDEVIDDIAKLYSERFTEKELKEISQFYRSEVGQKFVRSIPELAARGAELGRNWGQRIGQDLLKRVRAEMKKRGHDI